MAVRKQGNYTILVCLVGFVIAVSTIFLFYSQPQFTKKLDLLLYDYFLSIRGETRPLPIIAIVDIDEKSLEKHGQWPWNRYRIALLTDKLLEYGALSISLDMIFSEPDRTSPILLQEALKNDLGVNISFEYLPKGLYDNDLHFAESIKGKPIVLGAYLRYGEEGKFSPKEKELFEKYSPRVVENILPNGIPARTKIESATGLTMPLEILSKNSNIAFLNVKSDIDGLSRSAPLLAAVDGKLVPNLAIQSLMQATKVKNLDVRSDINGLRSISVGKIEIPVEKNGMMNIPYRGESRTYDYISAADVLDGSVEINRIKNKFIFVGSSAPGLLDLHATQFDKYFPGVEVHANILDAILTKDYIATPLWTPALQVILLLVNAVIGTYIFSKIGSAFTVLTLSALVTVYMMGASKLFELGMFISPIWQIFLLITLGIYVTAFRFWWEVKDKRKLRNIFNRYVSPEVVSRIVEQSDIRLEGEEREVTIMFTDVRGFTSISEKLLPQELVSLLNSYFTPMTSLVRNSEGTLDKFIGDAIMAFWNAPLYIENHSEKAVQTAIKMLEELEKINVVLMEKYEIALDMGIGIHTGNVYAGNMGSADLMTYTVIGDSVNVASRLEGLCTKLGFRIIISENCAAECGGSFIPLARLRVKGKEEPINIYTVFSKRERELYAEEMKAYLQAYYLYITALERKDVTILDDAVLLFAELVQNYEKRYLYQEYLDYCVSLKHKDFSEWDGVWTLLSK